MLTFLDIEISRDKGKCTTTVYKKFTFSGVYTHFESYQHYTNLVRFIPFLIVVSRLALIGQSCIDNLVF